MKIYLHIGQSKTGTSAIQFFLNRNRDALVKEGVLYPGVKVRGLTVDLENHNALADSLVGIIRFPYVSADEYFRQFFAEAQRLKAHTLIFSAEHFFGGEPRVWNVRNEDQYFQEYKNKLDALAHYLEGHDVSIILYLRPQIDWFASAVSHTIRIEGLIGKGGVYQNDMQLLSLMSPLLKYYDLVKQWQEIFPKCELQVVPYSKENLYERNSISDFINRIGLESVSFPETHRAALINTSLTREYIEVKKRFNTKERTKTQERIAIQCLETLSRKSVQGTSYLLAKDVLRKLEVLSLDHNRYLNQYFGRDKYEFTDRKSYNADLLQPLTREEIDIAYCSFEREYYKPKSYFMALESELRAILRNNARPVHSGLHQVKRLYRNIKSDQLSALDQK